MQKEGDSSDFGEIAPTTRHYPALQIKAKLVLRNRQAASVSFHGWFSVQAGVMSAGKYERYFRRGSKSALAVTVPHGCCQTCRRLFQWKPNSDNVAVICLGCRSSN